ncbi:MAG TPA: DedA family protein [candidate division Zixibacteria bacterium]|nr:DedA family protein [candidate division Zixibacteria bacterium]
MDFLKQVFDVFLNLDKHLAEMVENYGGWTHGILFLIVFCETGLVITPFLPGDSLLFAAGIFAGAGLLDLGWLMLILIAAAILGDAVNYSIGFRIGKKLLDNPNSRIFKKEYIERTHSFYEKYGGKTIIIARFVPIVRTFAPFLAGVGRMSYRRFALYNVTGAVAWVAIGVLAGYFFGSTDFVKNNFSLMILIVIIVSMVPGLYEFVRHKMKNKGEIRN